MKSMKKEINKWVKENVKNISLTNPSIHIHLDELGLEDNLNNDAIVDASIFSFQFLVNKMKYKTNYIPCLIVPLTSSNVINTIPPKGIKSIIKELDDSPPSLYIAHRDIFKFLYVREEYICPIFLDFFEVDNFYIYYKTTRDLNGIKNNFEFSRSIQIEYYPKKFRLT